MSKDKAVLMVAIMTMSPSFSVGGAFISSRLLNAGTSDGDLGRRRLDGVRRLSF